MTEISLRAPDDDLLLLLGKCDNAGLETLVGYITKKGKVTSQIESTGVYQRYHPNHQMYYDEIAAEIQKFGGNTIGNIMRGGKGVLYKEIVCDVADKLKVNYNKAREVEFIEMEILAKILEKAWEDMSDEAKEELLKGLSDQYKSGAVPTVFPAVIIQSAIRAGGFASFKISLVVANAVARAILGRGLSLAVNAGLARWMAVFAGPIGWALTALWTIFDVAAPAYRVTVPCVVHVAMLRQLQMAKAQGIDLNKA